MLIIDIKEYSSKWKIENESSRAKFGWASGQWSRIDRVKGVIAYRKLDQKQKQKKNKWALQTNKGAKQLGRLDSRNELGSLGKISPKKYNSDWTNGVRLETITHTVAAKTIAACA